MSQKATLQVVGSQTMHCTGCERTVTFTLSQLPGVKVIKADHKTQLIEIMLTGETNLDKVQTELDWIGYEVIPPRAIAPTRARHDQSAGDSRRL